MLITGPIFRARPPTFLPVNVVLLEDFCQYKKVDVEEGLVPTVSTEREKKSPHTLRNSTPLCGLLSFPGVCNGLCPPESRIGRLVSSLGAPWWHLPVSPTFPGVLMTP